MEVRISLARRILYTGIIAAFIVVPTELVLQAYYYAKAGDFIFRRAVIGIFEPDETRCYQLQPNLAYEHRTNEFDCTIYTNAQSFRTDAQRQEHAYAKPPDVYRVLFLGPSFTFGWGNEYEETYPTLIGERLKAPGKRIEVLNMGTPAQGPEAQLCWLKNEGFRFQPDLIVQTTYGVAIPNVVGECPETLVCPVVQGGKLYSGQPTLRQRAIAAAKNFAIVFYGFYIYDFLSSRQPVEPGKEWHGEAAKPVDPRDLDGLAAPYQKYLEFVATVVGKDTRVVFLHLPMSFVVHPADARRWSHILQGNPSAGRALIRAGAQRLREHGIVVVDPTERLIESGTSERLYYWLDIHLTPAGNRVVAEEAAVVLQPLLDAPPRAAL